MPRLAGRAIVSIQMPIALSDDTEPEPDVQILRRRSVPYKEREGYRDVTRVVGPAARIAPPAFPDVTLALTEIFA